jgi:hypothetical protein
MIEVALSLGIVAFALVAIMGVMPAGLNVQRQNREETIISQDAEYLLEAIRMGTLATNLNVLRSNITLLEATGIYNGNTNVFSWRYGYTPDPPPIGQILVHLNRPTNYVVNNLVLTNQVRIRFKGFSGNMATLAGNTNLNDAFQYEIATEIERVTPGQSFSLADTFRQGFISNNLYSVKLTFRWPVLPTGDLGLGSKSFHTQVRGSLVPVLYDAAGTSFTELERFNTLHDNLLPSPGSGSGTNAGFVFRRGFAMTFQ